MAAPEVRSFTSWKMDWINALMIGLDAREFRVAVCLLQFANQKTKLIFPSQAKMASLLGCSLSSVERAIATLVKGGWLEKSRVNRHLSNSYRFIEAKREQMDDLRSQRGEEYRADRWGNPDPAEVTGQDEADPAEVTGLDPSEVLAPDPAEVRGKHLQVTPESEHLNSGHESRGSLTERPAIVVSDSLRQSRAFRGVDPKATLDRIEQEQKRRGAA